MCVNKVKKSIYAFHKELTILYGDNMILGGSNALMLHGLILGREASDLDIIIYQPNEQQYRFLSSYILKDDEVGPEKYRRVFKFKTKEGSRYYKMDVIVVYEPTPPDLLYINIFDHPIKIQSIQNIINAKASYIIHKDNRGSDNYISQKDATDLQNLKSLNFNL